MWLIGSLTGRKKFKKAALYSGMSLLHLNETCLQHIVKLLDINSIVAVSKTCRRLHDVTSCYVTWNDDVMLKKVDAMIFKAIEAGDARGIQLMHETCLSAEKLQLSLEAMCEANMAKMLNKMDTLAVKMFSLLKRIDFDETLEVWPFCHVSRKDIQFALKDGSDIFVSYKSLIDKQCAFNDHVKLKVTISKQGRNQKTLLYDSNPRGLLDSGILPMKTSQPRFENEVAVCGEQDPGVLRPVFRLFEKELCSCEFTFAFFVAFVQNIGRKSEVDVDFDVARINFKRLAQNSQQVRKALERARKNRQKLSIEFLQLERKRHEIINSEDRYGGFIYCLGKLAGMGGSHLKNTRLRMQCIRDVFQSQRPKTKTSFEDLKLLPNVISNIDFDSITRGWACINPNLFTIWKEFTIKLGNGRNFKATISWEEKRDRLNEYSVANSEICLILHRKTLTVKSKMENPMDANERTRSIKHLKKAMKKLISRVQLRKTGLNEISSAFLFSILMTILND